MKDSCPRYDSFRKEAKFKLEVGRKGFPVVCDKVNKCGFIVPQGFEFEGFLVEVGWSSSGRITLQKDKGVIRV